VIISHKAHITFAEILELVEEKLRREGYQIANLTGLKPNDEDYSLDIPAEKLPPNDPALKKKYNKSGQPPSEAELARRAKLSETMKKVQAKKAEQKAEVVAASPGPFQS
jgi:hypothetical protein